MGKFEETEVKLSSDTKCPLCSYDSSFLTNKLRFGKTGDVRRCDKCSLVFLVQSSIDVPEDFYQTEYHQTYLAHVDPSVLDPAAYYSKMKEVTRPWADRVKGVLTGRESVLDVGCSAGYFLDEIKGSASKVFGHEINQKERDFCKKELGLDVSDEPLESRFEPNSFDVITLIFVLEHIGEPVSFLRFLSQFLKPNGRIIIVVPNVEDPLLNLYVNETFNNFYFCMEHLFYFSPKSLSQVLDAAGLKGEVLPIQEYPLANHLQWMYRGTPLDFTKSRQITPQTEFGRGDLTSEWEIWWQEANNSYHSLLKKWGMSDRVWADVRVVK